MPLSKPRNENMMMGGGNTRKAGTHARTRNAVERSLSIFFLGLDSELLRDAITVGGRGAADQV